MKKELGVIFTLLATASWAFATKADDCASIKSSWTNLLSAVQRDGEAAIRSQPDSQLQQAIWDSIQAQTISLTSQMNAVLSSKDCFDPSIQVTPPVPPDVPATPPAPPAPPSTPTPELPTPPIPPLDINPGRKTPSEPNEPPVITPPVPDQNPGNDSNPNNPRVEPPTENPDKPGSTNCNERIAAFKADIEMKKGTMSKSELVHYMNTKKAEIKECIQWGQVRSGVNPL